MTKRFFTFLNNIFDVEPPEIPPSLVEALDAVLSAKEITQHSKSLSDTNLYLEKPWMEFKEDDDFHDKIIHIFKERELEDESEREDEERAENPKRKLLYGVYVRAENNHFKKGIWQRLGHESSKKFLILDDDEAKVGDIYDMVYLDEDFFILRTQVEYGKKNYFFLIHEPEGLKLKGWAEGVEKLWGQSHDNSNLYMTVALIVVLLLAILYLI